MLRQGLMETSRADALSTNAVDIRLYQPLGSAINAMTTLNSRNMSVPLLTADAQEGVLTLKAMPEICN